jgi:urease accessory protein
MKRFTPVRFFALLAATFAFPALAHAHPSGSIVYDCASGLAHPFHGWDHLAAMIAVGVWAAQLGGRARWLMPTVFVAAMACAAMLGVRGISLPGVEPMIATSVLTLGVLIAAVIRLPIGASVAVIAAFAVSHGLAHGAEIPASSQPVSYAAGFVIATLALHAMGWALGHVAHRRFEFLPRALGAACAATGLVLLVS